MDDLNENFQLSLAFFNVIGFKRVFWVSLEFSVSAASALHFNFNSTDTFKSLIEKKTEGKLEKR